MSPPLSPAREGAPCLLSICSRGCGLGFWKLGSEHRWLGAAERRLCTPHGRDSASGLLELQPCGWAFAARSAQSPDTGCPRGVCIAPGPGPFPGRDTLGALGASVLTGCTWPSTVSTTTPGWCLQASLLARLVRSLLRRCPVLRLFVSSAEVVAGPRALWTGSSRGRAAQDPARALADTPAPWWAPPPLLIVGESLTLDPTTTSPDHRLALSERSIGAGGPVLSALCL